MTKYKIITKKLIGYGELEEIVFETEDYDKAKKYFSKKVKELKLKETKSAWIKLYETKELDNQDF